MSLSEKCFTKVNIGVALVILSFFVPLLSLIVPMLGWETTISTLIISFLVIGAPELCLFLAAIIAGKEVLKRVTTPLKRFFKFKAPPKPVSRRRHRIGIFSLIIGIILPWITIYLPYLLPFDLPKAMTLSINLIGDAVLIASFFILGPPFFEKLHHLFVYEPLDP